MESGALYFKTCLLCNTSWYTVDDFIRDPEVDIIGYQPHPAKTGAGLFIFGHRHCNSSISVRLDALSELQVCLTRDAESVYIIGPDMIQESCSTATCFENCLRKTDSANGNLQCECSYVREVMQIIKHLPKNGCYLSPRY